MRITAVTNRPFTLPITVVLLLLLPGALAVICFAGDTTEANRKKILVVSSYHREYAWTQETNAGLCAALLKLGWLSRQPDSGG
ncbi:MAG: hypothetical protein P8X63_05245 [Desulfuromonadaceae bacterium]